jgi:hypothetical protein
MKYSTGIFNKTRSKAGIAGVMLFFAFLAITGCEQSTGNVLPVEGAGVVVERFYDYISEAKIKGGATPLREAYKLISSKKSRLSQAKFIEIASKYPSGFRADITNAEINGAQARVTIAYKMPSAFGAYTVTTDIPLNLDTATNTWKIDFTGEMDGQEKLIASQGSQ